MMKTRLDHTEVARRIIAFSRAGLTDDVTLACQEYVLKTSGYSKEEFLIDALLRHWSSAYKLLENSLLEHYGK